MKKHRKYIFLVGIIALLFIGYQFADRILFSGVRPIAINEDNFQASYFSKNNIKNQTAIILLGGGQWGGFWAQQFANNDLVGFSIPYTGKEGLSKLPEEIELEYFENAINWLRLQPEVNPNKIIVMGASRNAELALIIASTFPKYISGVIAYAPSSVSWSNTVLPYNSNEIKESWKYKGIDIPYIPMKKISVNNSGKINMIEYWTKGLNKIDSTKQAVIKVENINGPILLFSGNDDKVWPSSFMADMIEQRLKKNNFQFSFQNIKYNAAGHSISGDPDNNSSYRTGIITIEGKDYEFEFGGTSEGDFKAKQDAKIKIQEFLNKI